MKRLYNKLFTFIIIALFFYFLAFILKGSMQNWQWHKIIEYKSFLLKGILTTILVSFVAFLLSLIFGILLYSATSNSILLFKYLANAFIYLVQGTPLIVYVLVGYYVVVHSLGVNNRFFSGALILGTFYSVSISQIIESAIKGIDSFVWLTAKSLGFTKFGMYRYIIIPGLWKTILPTLTYQTASLIKDSSLLSIIALQEFYQATTESSNQSYATLEFYLAMACGYLLLTIPLRFLSHFLEKRVHHEN